MISVKPKKIFQLSFPILLAMMLMAAWLFLLPGGATAQTTALPVINEFVANTTGTDVDEFVEIFGDPSTNYFTYTVLTVEGDSTSNVGTVDGVWQVGTTDANGYWTTGSLSNGIENGTQTLLLVEEFSGTVSTDLDTDNDGVIDVTPWSTIIDSVGVNDGGGTDIVYSPVILSPGYDGMSFTPGGASRIPNGADSDSAADWMRNDFDGAGLPGYTGTAIPGEAYNTPGAVNQEVVLINEFVANHTGTDTNEFIEVFGLASTDYSAYTLLQIEGDSTGAGTIDRIWPVGSSDASGYWFSGYLNNSIENGTVSLLLVSGFSGALSDDLDTDNDGVLDVTPWISVADSVAVTDGDMGDWTYADISLAPSFDGGSVTVGGASRIPNGVDSDQPADWVRNDFDGEGIPGFIGTPQSGEALNTPGSVNILISYDNDLSVTKSGPLIAQPGDDLIYTITLENLSAVTVTNVVLTDTLAVSTTYVSDSSAIMAANPSIGVYVWSYGDVPGMFSETFQLTVTVDAAAPDGLDLVNTVLVDTNMTGDDPANSTDTWLTGLKQVIPIHDVQYVPDPVTADASALLGQLVVVEGVVTAEPGEIEYSTTTISRTFTIQDPAGGPWSGLTVYSPNGLAGLSIPEGTLVRVVGTVTEYFGLTELTLVNGASDVAILSTGNPLPAPQVLPTGDYQTAATAEQWESVLVEFQNADVTATLTFGEWAFDDGSGATNADDSGAYDGDLTYLPVVGDTYRSIRGIASYTFSVYKIEPRYDSDIGLRVDTPIITKSAPAQVLPGSVYTYTITVQNLFDYTLTGVGIGDSVPANTTLAYVLDGGVPSGGFITWSVGDLAPFASAVVRFAVTAPNFATTVTNVTYGVQATNFVTATLGAPVPTVVGDHILIRQIQGSGDTSPYVGGDVFGVRGVVTNIHYNNATGTSADAFFMQDPSPDGNTLTSEGIYVYAPTYADSLQVGDAITVSGTVEEYFGMTQIGNVTAAVTGTTSATILPVVVAMPVPVGTTLERYEGMLIEIDDLTVSQNYFQGRYGQLTLSSQGRMYNPTNGNGLGDTFDLDMRRMIILDDNTSGQNPDPIPYVGQDNTNRAGDLIPELTGTLDYGPINSNSPPARHYRLMPTEVVTITRINQRTTAPEVVGGNLKVASFNVLNYFTTLDTGSPVCGPSGGLDCRGANTPEEFIRQRTKIITALLAIDADVIGLMEIENHPTDAAVIDLVNGLNAISGAGTYDYVATGPVGTDAIKVALIYNASRVSPVGSYLVDNDPIHDRPPVAQAFSLDANGEVFVAVVNHFKSKGSCPPPGDPNADQGDGQGCWNLKRVQQAQALLTFIDTIETSTGDADVLVIGDLNSYGIEDPILTLTGAGLTDEAAQFIPAASRYSYVFDGLAGYLDHALATTSLDAQIAGATFWHINADEPVFLDYNTEFNPPQYYQPDAYRSSDHDPVMVGINLGSPSLNLTKAVTPTVDVDLGGVVTYTITLDNSGTQPANGVLLTDTLPAAVDFGGWVQQSGAAVVNDEITWSGNLSTGASVTLVFTATVVNDVAYNGQTVLNSAAYQLGAHSGSADASFEIRFVNYVYLPVVIREFTP